MDIGVILKENNMKFLVSLAILVVIVLKTVFGFVDASAETVYEGSHRTGQVLNELEL